MTVLEFISKYRIFPRAFTVAFFVLTYQIFEWFMALPEPNPSQAGFVMTMAGGLVYAMKAYSDNGIKVKMASEHNSCVIKQKEIDAGLIIADEEHE